jgi:hypothetical protein
MSQEVVARTVNGVRWIRGPKPRGIKFRNISLLDERGKAVAVIQQVAPNRAVWSGMGLDASAGIAATSVAECQRQILEELAKNEKFIFVRRRKLISTHGKVPVPPILRFYRCCCKREWTDVWDCACDDRCPECGSSISLYGQIVLKHADSNP